MKLTNHSPIDGEDIGICARCGKPSADSIHHPVFPGDYEAHKGGVAVKRWPFVETPLEFTNRLALAYEACGDGNLLGAVRNVLIENPPTFVVAPPDAGLLDVAERALEPFANIAKAYDDVIDPDDRPVGPFKLGFCRTCREALVRIRTAKGAVK